MIRLLTIALLSIPATFSQHLPVEERNPGIVDGQRNLRIAKNEIEAVDVDIPVLKKFCGTGEGIPSCNCKDAKITGANIPHSKTTGVNVTKADGSIEDVGGQGTGLSGTAYSGQEIQPGKCKYVKYQFKCTESLTWVCWVTSFSLEERDATKAECP